MVKLNYKKLHIYQKLQHTTWLSGQGSLRQRKMDAKNDLALLNQYRIEYSKEFLTLCGTYPIDIIDIILTGNESWEHFHSPGKGMETIFW